MISYPIQGVKEARVAGANERRGEMDKGGALTTNQRTTTIRYIVLNNISYWIVYGCIHRYDY